MGLWQLIGSVLIFCVLLYLLMGPVIPWGAFPRWILVVLLVLVFCLIWAGMFGLLPAMSLK
jgi:hypothetical protein